MTTIIKEWIKRLPLFMLCQGYVNISFIFFILLTSVTGFFVHVQISSYHIIVSFALTVIISLFLSWHYYGLNKNVNLKISTLWLIVLTISLIISGTIATNFYDVSYDGQWYHQGGISLLSNGWNPVYEKIPDTVSGNVPINHYPKAIEITSACITAFTHHIEDGKLFNLFLIFTSFLICFPVIVQIFPKIGYGYILILSIIIALNPICIYQSLSYYVDGQLASLLTIFVFLLILTTKKIDYTICFIISFVMIQIINIKMYAIAYLVVFLFGYLLFNYVNHKVTKHHLILLLSIFFGIIIGFHPYIINTIDHSNPFYPVIGSTTIVPPNTPVSLLDKNSLEKIFMSTFSRSQILTSESEWKIPFTFSITELGAFQYPDVRIGGFGPLFSGIVILSLIVILMIIKHNKDMISLYNFIVFVCPLILLTVIVNPEAWWARYVPQLWLVPPIILLLSYERISKVHRVANYLLIIVLILNIIIISNVYYPYQFGATNTINNELDLVKNCSQNNTLYVNFNEFFANEERFKERNIIYVKDVKGENLSGYNFTMFASTTRIYLP